jgi:hypothetical protein
MLDERQERQNELLAHHPAPRIIRIHRRELPQLRHLIDIPTRHLHRSLGGTLEINARSHATSTSTPHPRPRHGRHQRNTHDRRHDPKILQLDTGPRALIILRGDRTQRRAPPRRA